MSHRDGNWELYRMAPDGSSQERLTERSANETQPDWSPDSRSLVFVRGRDVWTRDLESGSETRLTRKQVERSPIWSPDGRFIAFVRPYRGRDTLVVKPVAGGSGRVLAGSEWIRDLSWRGVCTVRGSEGSDRLRGKGIRDLACGPAGDDTIWSGPGNDLVYGDEGNDRLHGGPGDDVIRGGPADSCRADPGDRTIGC
ncbi:MAG TPA: DPP IV N-terminal domain-containing protein [Gaiellaceae bacterium]|nr:DPP IV N-terminal domain-containing protein [Gaiellaceae bacterium]